jgi:chemotaxis protein CheZ
MSEVEDNLVSLVKIAAQVESVVGIKPEEVKAQAEKEADIKGEGPQIKAEEREDVVGSQDEVDDLLSSLGF